MNIKIASILTLVGVSSLFVSCGDKEKDEEQTSFSYSVPLSGKNEFPPFPSESTGLMTASYNKTTNELNLKVDWDLKDGLGKVNKLQAMHLHFPATEIQIAPDKPENMIPIQLAETDKVKKGSVSHKYTLTDQQEEYLLKGLIYINVHTDVFDLGEIRGQLK